MVKVNQEKMHAVLLCVILCFDTVKTGLLTFLRFFVRLPFGLDTALIYLALVVIVLCALSRIIKNVSVFDFFFVLIFFVLILISMFRMDGYDSYFKLIIKGFLPCVLAFFTMRAFDDDELLLRYLRITAFVITIACIITYSGGLGDEESYNQYFGYCVLPAAIISGDAFFDSKEKWKGWHLANYFVAFFLCLFSGARGPLAFAALIFAVKIIFRPAKNPAVKILSVVLIAALAILLVVYIEPILLQIREIALSLNLSTRSIDRFLEKEFASDLERQRIMAAAFRGYYSNSKLFFLGYGICIDRIKIANAMHYPQEEIIGAYPHNIFAEFLLQFGAFIGAAISLALVVLIVKAFLNMKHNPKCFSILLILFFVGFIPLLVSGSYITSKLFFLFFAYVLNILRTQKRTRYCQWRTDSAKGGIL